MQFIKMIMRFDKIIRGIVNGIKKGVDLFKEIISGKGLKGIIEDFISALQSLPEKVTYILIIVFVLFQYTKRKLQWIHVEIEVLVTVLHKLSMQNIIRG